MKPEDDPVTNATLNKWLYRLAALVAVVIIILLSVIVIGLLLAIIQTVWEMK